MVALGLTGVRRSLALAALVTFALGACKKTAAQRAETSAPAYGAGHVPLSIDSREDYTPLATPPSPEQLRAFPLIDGARPANLTLPVSWDQDPYRSRSWSMQLHAWRFMPPFLLGFDAQHDPRVLRAAADLALDWLKSHASAAEKQSKFVWYDMAVAARATYLAYLVRAGGISGILKPEERETLLAATVAHGEWLAADENYLDDHNHGLYSDLALLTLCKTLDRLPACDSWRPLARRRSLENFRATVTTSGVHREHTPSYHFAMIRLLERRLEVDDDASLRKMLLAMKEAGGWYLQPDGYFPQLGDCHDSRAPDWAVAAAAKLEGARFFEDAALYSFKSPTAQLLVTGAHHSQVHKHKDDLSFVLSEAGRRLLIDPGFLTYNKSKQRDFLRSARAHNVCLIDQQWVKPKKLPRLSLRASGEAGGWYAVTGDDLHTLQGITHQRTWLYAPGRVLVVVDDFVSDGKPHELTRYFHFAPDVQTKPSPHGLQLSAPGIEAELFDASPGNTEVQTFKGLREAPYQGLVSPSEDVLVDAPAVEMRTPLEGDGTTLLSVVELSARPARGSYRTLERAPGHLVLSVDGTRISLTRALSKLEIVVGAAAK